MGGGPVNYSDVRKYYDDSPRITRATRVQEVFTETRMNDLYNPAKMKLPREARDSALSPRSRGVIFAEDGTGSMGHYILDLIQKQFPKLIRETYKSVTWNPHIMFGLIGDVAAGDRAPLQMTQFETDLRMLDQMKQLWVEGYGGGNGSESYILAWYFAATCISMDCYEKRGEKGFLFTFGDEGPTPYLTSEEIRTVFGNRKDVKYPRKQKLYFADCYEMASEKFNCYHILLNGGGYDRNTVAEWKECMGGNALDLYDQQYLTELVTTIFKMHDGMKKSDALYELKSNSGSAYSAVKRAIEDLPEVVDTSCVNVSDAKADIEEF